MKVAHKMLPFVSMIGWHFCAKNDFLIGGRKARCRVSLCGLLDLSLLFDLGHFIL